MEERPLVDHGDPQILCGGRARDFLAAITPRRTITPGNLELSLRTGCWVPRFTAASAVAGGAVAAIVRLGLASMDVNADDVCSARDEQTGE